MSGDQEIAQLMDDIVTRIEEKAFREEHITNKISQMRSKLRSSDKGSKSD